MSKRQSLSMAERILLAHRQQYKCNECKTLLPPTWEADHIVALMNGGTNEISNFQILCPNCHAVKTQIEVIEKAKARAVELGWTMDNAVDIRKRQQDTVDTRAAQIKWLESQDIGHDRSNVFSLLESFRYK